MGDVRFSPKSRHVQRTSECRLWAKSGHRGHSFDHLICARYQRLWHTDTERLRGFLIDDQLDLGGLLDRKIGWLLPLENPGGGYPAQTIRLLEIGSVAHETAGDRKLSIRIYGWHCMAGRQLDEPITLGQALRNPITGIAGCCALAMSGHTAAPLRSVMNSRRLIVCRSPEARTRHRTN